MSNGVIFYDGPSLLTGDPIVGVVTGLDGRSNNPKTGPMAQAWILHADMSAVDAVRTGADDAICGACRYRSGSNIGRACYTIVWLAPQQVYRALDRYPSVSPLAASTLLARLHVRLGAYGDPAAIPFDVWSQLTQCARGWTGYTHQWATCDDRFKALMMASVDTVAEQQDAAARGWRTFRVRAREGAGHSLVSTECVCPASSEGGHRSTCQECGLCRGTAVSANHVAILPHGQRVKWIAPEGAPA